MTKVMFGLLRTVGGINLFGKRNG